MNQLQKDILHFIQEDGPITTADLCAQLDSLGYGRTIDWDKFKSNIGKTISKMKAEGHVIGEDRPNPGTKPVRYWALPEADQSGEATEMVKPDQFEDKLEMVEQAGEWSDAKTFEETPKEKMNDFLLDKLKEKECTEWKQLLPSKPMSVSKSLDLFKEACLDEAMMPSFLDGIAAAERHHGISE